MLLGSFPGPSLSPTAYEAGKRLFHAIVVVGASMGGCGTSEIAAPAPGTDGSAAPDGAAADGALDAEPAGGEDGPTLDGDRLDAAADTADATAVADATDAVDAPADSPSDVGADVSFPHITK